MSDLPKEDILKDHRGINTGKDSKFYQWLGKNCSHAKSHAEVRQLLSGIKKPLREAING